MKIIMLVRRAGKGNPGEENFAKEISDSAYFYRRHFQQISKWKVELGKAKHIWIRTLVPDGTDL